MKVVGVVGAGISGLVASTRLLERSPGLQVVILEWGRGPGGRTARKRVPLPSGAEVSFDHATPFFCAHTRKFRELLSGWEAAGVALRWPEAGADVWVGHPTNNAIARSLVSGVEAAGGEVRFGHHVRSARYEAGAWHVRAEERATGAAVDFAFDALLLSDKLLVLPNEYSVLQAESVGPLALPARLASSSAIVLLVACTALSSHAPLVRPEVPASIRLIVTDSLKPGTGRQRADGLAIYVAHSTNAYAEAHLAGDTIDDASSVLEEMLRDFKSAMALPPWAEISTASGGYANVFLWDHAQPTADSTLPEAYRLDAGRRLGLCGDFFRSGGAGVDGANVQGVEAAALSGLAVADALAPLLQDGRQGTDELPDCTL